MKLSPLTLGAMALATLLVALPSSARADLIPWTYNWSRSPAEIYSDNNNSKVTLTDESSHEAAGDSNIVATNLRTVSNASPDNPDKFTAQPYKLILTLKDKISGQSGTVVFTGQLDGYLSALSSTLENTFTSPNTQTIVLGNHRYTATMPSFTPPGPPDATNSGSISTLVKIKVEALPEPSTLVLSGLGGVTLLVTGRMRRWRRRCEEQSRRKRA